MSETRTFGTRDRSKVTFRTVARFGLNLFKLGATTAAGAVVLGRYGFPLTKAALHGNVFVSLVNVAKAIATAWKSGNNLDVGVDMGTLHQSWDAIRDALMVIWDDPAQRKLLLASLAAVATWSLGPTALVKLQHFFAYLADARSSLLVVGVVPLP